MSFNENVEIYEYERMSWGEDLPSIMEGSVQGTFFVKTGNCIRPAFNREKIAVGFDSPAMSLCEMPDHTPANTALGHDAKSMRPLTLSPHFSPDCTSVYENCFAISEGDDLSAVPGTTEDSPLVRLLVTLFFSAEVQTTDLQSLTDFEFREFANWVACRLSVRPEFIETKAREGTLPHFLTECFQRRTDPSREQMYSFILYRSVMGVFKNYQLNFYQCELEKFFEHYFPNSPEMLRALGQFTRPNLDSRECIEYARLLSMSLSLIHDIQIYIQHFFINDYKKELVAKIRKTCLTNGIVFSHLQNLIPVNQTVRLISLVLNKLSNYFF